MMLTVENPNMREMSTHTHVHTYASHCFAVCGCAVIYPWIIDLFYWIFRVQSLLRIVRYEASD